MLESIKSKIKGHPKVAEIVSHIDVLWFGGDTDMLVPEFAFEVEHTTDVTKGLGRLLDLHRSGQRTRLFIILPDDKMSKFDKEIGRSLFRDIKGICRARTYEPLINLYSLAKEHNLQRTEFFEFFNSNRNRSDGADFNYHFEGSAF